jgi:peroxiredoxin
LAACFAASLFLGAITGDAQGKLVNQPAPNFSRLDLHRARVRLTAYRGKVVLLNFWATWCIPCRLEMPRFVDWQDRFGGQGLQVVGVSIDDDDAQVRPFVEKLKVNYPVVMGDARLGERYGGVLGVPVTLLIDRHGVIRARFEGEADLGRIESEMRDLLGAPAH